MENIFILHGSFGNPYNNWFPWLANELIKQNKNVYVPAFPIGIGYQNYSNWSNIFKSYVSTGLINENTIIIGHSIAPVFIIHFLIENKIKVNKLIFVSGFNNYLGINEEYDTVNNTMYTNEIENIKIYCNNITCLYSNNDPYVPLNILEDFANKVANKKILLPNSGHLNAEAGYYTFEEIIKYI